MSDRIYLHGMVFEGRHGVTEEERESPQQIEVDIELELDLRPAGTSDDLGLTVDYAQVFEVCREVVEDQSFNLLEGIGEALAAQTLGRFPSIEKIRANVKKPGAPLAGMVEHAGVRIERSRVDTT
jgi:7,8-dihydroneopterin aldolase/epimerase/oxygenase